MEGLLSTGPTPSSFLSVGQFSFDDLKESIETSQNMFHTPYFLKPIFLSLVGMILIFCSRVIVIITLVSTPLLARKGCMLLTKLFAAHWVSKTELTYSIIYNPLEDKEIKTNVVIFYLIYRIKLQGWRHITFVKTHQDGLKSGTEARYRSEQISSASPSHRLEVSLIDE